jgi:hypothetical protein
MHMVMVLLRQLWHRLQRHVGLWLVLRPLQVQLQRLLLLLLCCQHCCLLRLFERSHERQQAEYADAALACCGQQVKGPPTPYQLLYGFTAMRKDVIDDKDCAILSCAAAVLLVLLLRAAVQVMQPVGLMLP